MKVFTIGFTKKSAELFFETLRTSGTKRVVDVRLNNVSQLAGFAKKDDLAYFLREIDGMEYVHLPILAPTQELLENYRKRRCDWKQYEAAFLELMKHRRIESTVPRDLIEDGSEGFERTTPGRGEVDQHQDTGIDNFGLEVEVVEHLNFLGCHGCSLRRKTNRLQHNAGSDARKGKRHKTIQNS